MPSHRLPYAYRGGIYLSCRETTPLLQNPNTLIIDGQVAEFGEIAHDCFCRVVDGLDNLELLPECRNSVLADPQYGCNEEHFL
jgi:hypothetical protein